jgi:hypothetical protein
LGGEFRELLASTQEQGLAQKWILATKRETPSGIFHPYSTYPTYTLRVTLTPPHDRSRYRKRIHEAAFHRGDHRGTAEHGLDVLKVVSVCNFRDLIPILARAPFSGANKRRLIVHMTGSQKKQCESAARVLREYWVQSVKCEWGQLGPHSLFHAHAVSGGTVRNKAGKLESRFEVYGVQDNCQRFSALRYADGHPSEVFELCHHALNRAVGSMNMSRT